MDLCFVEIEFWGKTTRISDNPAGVGSAASLEQENSFDLEAEESLGYFAPYSGFECQMCSYQR
jgi:hypothetical protein